MTAPVGLMPRCWAA